MKQELKNIISGQGLGTLKFGFSRIKVTALLGEPNEIEAYSYTDSEEDLTESWHYDDLELSLVFDEVDDWRLVGFVVTSDFYQFKKAISVGMKKADLEAELNKLNVKDIQVEDISTAEDLNNELLSSDSLAMNFWLDAGEIAEIQWGPKFKDEDTIDWPK